VRARAASLGLVAALGLLLLISLVASAAISALGDMINAYLPFGEMILMVINAVVSFVLIAVMFGAIYKVLPDRNLEWRDVGVGALVTAALFTLGKSLIGWYIGTSAIASSYGAAGGLLVILLWVYYSSEIFLLGAEFTRAYSIRHGSRADLAPLMHSREADTSSYQTVTSTDQPSSLILGGRQRVLDLVWLFAVAWASSTLTELTMRSRRQ
jgi:membrane protein